MTSSVAGIALFAFGVIAIGDPMGRAFWGVFAAVMLLPLAARLPGAAGHVRMTRVLHARVDEYIAQGNPKVAPCDLFSYAIACVPPVIGTAITSGILPAIVVASIVFSLAGLLALLVRIRIPCTLAIGLLILQSLLVLTWPIWASHLLLMFDSRWLVDLLVKIGPLFAINAAIDPTDAFTHRPLAYRLMNLGQDIPYQMPATVWWCVGVHVLVGLPGLLAWKFESRNPNEE